MKVCPVYKELLKFVDQGVAMKIAEHFDNHFDIKPKSEKSGVKAFDKFLVSLFIICVKLSRDREVCWRADRAKKNSAMLKEILPDVVLSKDIRKSGLMTGYARIGDLKYWGLLTQREEHWHSGIYQITRLGHKFLLGYNTIPREVKLSGGVPIEFSGDYIDIRQAYGKDWNQAADWIAGWRRQHVDIISEQIPLLERPDCTKE